MHMSTSVALTDWVNESVCCGIILVLPSGPISSTEGTIRQQTNEHLLGLCLSQGATLSGVMFFWIRTQSIQWRSRHFTEIYVLWLNWVRLWSKIPPLGLDYEQFGLHLVSVSQFSLFLCVGMLLLLPHRNRSSVSFLHIASISQIVLPRDCPRQFMAGVAAGLH